MSQEHNQFTLPWVLKKLELTDDGGSGYEAVVRKALLGEVSFAVKEYFPMDKELLMQLGSEVLDDISEFNALGSQGLPQTLLVMTNHPETGIPTLYAVQTWAEKGILKEKSYREILNSKELRESLGQLLLEICEYYEIYGKMPDAVGANDNRIGRLSIPSIKKLFPHLSENIAISQDNTVSFIDPHVNRENSSLSYKIRAEIQNISYKIFASILLKNDPKVKETEKVTPNEEKVKGYLSELPVKDIGPSDKELLDDSEIGKGRNILVVTESFNGVHGVAFSVKNYLRYLKLNGFNPVLVTSGKDDKTIHDEEFGEIIVIKGKRTPGGDREVSLGVKKVSAILSSRKFSAAYIYNPAVIGLQVLMHPKLRNIPTVSTAETRIGKYLRYEFPGKTGILAQKAYEKIGIKLKKRISKYVEAIVTPSESYQNTLRKRGVEKARCIGKTANISEDNFNVEKSEELRELIAPNGEKILIFVGKVSRVKNLDFLARTCNLLNQRKVKYKLLIVGSNENETELNRIKNLFDREKTLFVGNQQGYRLANLYKVADIFTSPSSSETLGLTTIEAQLFGLPALVSNHIGSVDAIKNNETGLNLSVEIQGDAKVWATQIEKLFFDDDLREKMGKKAELQEYTSWKNHCKQLLDLVRI